MCIRDSYEGQELDLTGGSLKVVYESEDNYTETIPLAMSMISGYNPSKVGVQTLVVTYGGKTATFLVVVQVKTASSVEIATVPAKTAYEEGDALDLTGGSITVNYTAEELSAETIAITEDMVSGYDPFAVGTQTLTVT